jgi:hypothetical protein
MEEFHNDHFQRVDEAGDEYGPVEGRPLSHQCHSFRLVRRGAVHWVALEEIRSIVFGVLEPTPCHRDKGMRSL